MKTMIWMVMWIHTLPCHRSRKWLLVIFRWCIFLFCLTQGTFSFYGYNTVVAKMVAHCSHPIAMEMKKSEYKKEHHQVWAKWIILSIFFMVYFLGKLFWCTSDCLWYSLFSNHHITSVQFISTIASPSTVTFASDFLYVTVITTITHEIGRFVIEWTL
jgi:hypothetical protein